MDKGRAIIINAMTRMRERAGEAELINCPKHIYWEACKLIKENKWEKEAHNYLQNLIKEAEEKLTSVKKEFLEYLLRGEEDKDLEKKFMKEFQKFNVNGIEEEKVRFQAKNGREPSKDEILEISKKREAEDYANLKAFVEEQAKIYLEKEFNLDILTRAAKKLKERGLFKIALKNIPWAMTNVFLRDTEKFRDNPGIEYILYW